MKNLVAVALVLIPGAAFAERTVSLEEAYRIAVDQNLDLAAARAGYERADALVQEAWGLLKPSVIGTGTYTFHDRETTREFIPGTPPIVIQPRDSFGASLVVRQPLFNGQSWLLLENAYDNRETAQLTTESARQGIVLMTARAYWSVVTARRVLEVNQNLRGVTDANLRAAQARLDAGTGLGIDVTRAQIDVQVADRQIANAQAALEDAKQALGLVLGSSEPVDAAEPPAAVAEPAPVDAAASGTTPAVRAAALREQIADRAVSAAWWAIAPTLDAAWILTWTDSPGAFGGRETQWQIVATLTVPFYDGGLRYGVIRERQADRAQARAVSERTEREARNELRSAERAVDTQRVSVQTAERQVELARQALSQSQAAYEAGASTNLEVIQAQQALRDAEVALVIGRAEWQIAVVRLLVAAGRA